MNNGKTEFAYQTKVSKLDFISFLVLDVDDNSKEVQLSFMVKRGNLYLWPDDPDISWESFDSIDSALPEPRLSEKSTNRRNFFVFE